ncbi:MAG TPA: cell division protein ZapA [Xanthomonadales bacterium]|nr:cell division protein ZapA [Xanthomonadales bacterium]
MNATPEPVKVNILDREYQFACPEEEREALKEAARELDDHMREIKDSGRLMSLERIALQAALNYCDETVKLRKSAASRDEKIDSKIRMLADQLDEALAE